VVDGGCVAHGSERSSCMARSLRSRCRRDSSESPTNHHTLHHSQWMCHYPTNKCLSSFLRRRRRRNRAYGHVDDEHADCGHADCGRGSPVQGRSLHSRCRLGSVDHRKSRYRTRHHLPRTILSHHNIRIRMNWCTEQTQSRTGTPSTGSRQATSECGTEGLETLDTMYEHALIRDAYAIAGLAEQYS